MIFSWLYGLLTAFLPARHESRERESKSPSECECETESESESTTTMGDAAVVRDLKLAGPGGLLVPLRTAMETRARNEMVEVWVTSVPFKKASRLLDVIRQLHPDDGGRDLQHLRRFAKYVEVPRAVRTQVLATRNFLFPRAPDVEKQEMLLVLGASDAVSEGALREALTPFLKVFFVVPVDVPALAPTSQEQAAQCSRLWWPTVYKKSNPFGPHPSIVQRAQDEMEGDVQRWMGLAVEAGRQAAARGCGEGCGVAVVERRNGVARSVAVAGDARWLEWPREGSGNVTAHAAMRAIALISEGLRVKEEAELEVKQPALAREEVIFRDDALSEFEAEHYVAPSDDGYLCNNLEIYCSHEPCVMCSMAIVHSRFGRIVFRQKMLKTGGMYADGELGHGLFWRKELNWSMLAWQWVPAGELADGSESCCKDTLNV